MHQYRIDLSIGMPGYTDADEWRLKDGWFQFVSGGEVKAQYPELSVKSIRRTGDEMELIAEYVAPGADLMGLPKSFHPTP